MTSKATRSNRGSLPFVSPSADLGRRTARGAATAVSALLIRILIQLGTAAALARLLAPADFGLVAMAATLTSFVGLFSDLGLSTATVQQNQIEQATISTLFYFNLAIGLLLMLICAVMAPLAAWVFGDDRVLGLVIALGISIPVSAASAQHRALLQRGMRWAGLQWTPVLGQCAGGVISIILAWKTEIGYWALVTQAWTIAVASTLLYWWICPWRPSRLARWSEVRSPLRFGLYLTGFNFVNYFHRQFDDVLVGWRWGATDLGYYTRAYTLLTLPLTLVSGPVASAVVPALSRVQGEPERWQDLFLKTFGAINLVSAGLTAILITAAKPLVLLLYGPGWDEVGHVFIFLAISMFAATPMNAMGWVYISLGQTPRALRWGLRITPIYVIAFMVGLPFGIEGVALCYSMSVCLAAVPCLSYSTRISPVRLGQMLRLALPPALLGIFCIALVSLSHIISVYREPMARLVETSVLTGGLYLTGAIVILLWDPAQQPFRKFLREWYLCHVRYRS